MKRVLNSENEISSYGIDTCLLFNLIMYSFEDDCQQQECTCGCKVFKTLDTL